MVTSNSTPDEKEALRLKLESMDIKDLISQGQNDQDEIDSLQYRLGVIKFIIRNHMINNGAKSILHSEVECKAKFAPTTYKRALISSFMKERFNEKELLDLGYTPPVTREVTDPEKWDMRVVKGIAEYGTDFIEMLERATVPGDMVDISLKRK